MCVARLRKSIGLQPIRHSLQALGEAYKRPSANRAKRHKFLGSWRMKTSKKTLRTTPCGKTLRKTFADEPCGRLVAEDPCGGPLRRDPADDTPRRKDPAGALNPSTLLRKPSSVVATLRKTSSVEACGKPLADSPLRKAPVAERPCGKLHPSKIPCGSPHPSTPCGRTLRITSSVDLLRMNLADHLIR